jgi:hypothetical protein
MPTWRITASMGCTMLASALTDRLLSLPDVARHLGCNVDRVRALVRAGQLRAVDLNVRPGQRRYRHLKVSRQALADFLSQREVLVAPAPRSQRRRRLEQGAADWINYYTA